MIEVVTETDLDRLGAITPHSPNAKMRAACILTEIVNRLSRPRAYISEPTHMSDVALATFWCVAYDILSAELSAAGTSVIEPESMRDVALFCSELDRVSDSTDPLWQALMSAKLIDEVYIPADGENSKRHAAMRRIARSAGIRVYSYRPQRVTQRRPATPPRT